MNRLYSLALALLFISLANLPAMSGDVSQASEPSTIQTEIPVNPALSLTDLEGIVPTENVSTFSGEISGLSIIVAQMEGSEEDEDEGDEDSEDEDEGDEDSEDEDGNTEDTE